MRYRTLKQDRLGLMMIIGTLIAIAMIVAALEVHKLVQHGKRVRSQGVGLTQALSSLPFDQLVNAPERQGLLQTMVRVQRSPDFAYGLLVSPTGRSLVEVAVTGAPPDAAPPVEPALWFGERELRSPDDGRPIVEFHSPVMRDGNLAGFVRIGYFSAPPPLAFDQLSFSALLALPVFLLSPLFYFLVRREMKPLAALAEQMQGLSATLGPSTPLPANLQVQQFAQRIGQFLAASEARIRELESDRVTSATSNRLLAYRQGKVEAVLHSIPEGILVMDDAGKATFANTRLETLLGTVRGKIIGNPAQQWCVNPMVLDFLSLHPCAGGTARIAQTEIDLDGPTSRRIAIASYPLFSPQDHGVVFGTLVVFRDVTQVHLAKNAGAEFVAHVSHELKTPLGTLTAYSEILMDTENLTDSLRVESANVIHDEAQRMAALINNLLNISKLDTGAISLDPHPVNLRDLLRDAFDSLRQSAHGKALRFHVEVPPNLGLVALDKDLFRIALNNLLSNATKYNVQGGSVTLAAGESGEDHIDIFVRDSGIGIGAEDRERIFEKYYRANTPAADGIPRTGHGLGLYLARQIVELHQGSITVRSEPGKGTEFCIRIPKHATRYEEILAA